ncbi:hypothetical protein [Frigoribacterium faeni]|uniref:Uncharacterized protein n=1 Tax=Frigoribacterium faeni TaxID=145483 RepID=A0A7W3PJY5_9MICO|nr:hypothetical protein [Frigoribacterium faeni]MBA8814558.1 hypothetical protein [Frigoribacterium faeni]BFF15925.1 hypothetical protein GCM10025699_72280 [Microbacterium flavescens]GEK84553.1 hypothetical protein FFA01_28620 [Frigoribacterium faeni]
MTATAAPATGRSGDREDDRADGATGLPDRASVVPGHVSTAARVLTRVAVAVVAETLRVDRREVHVDARDDDGRLALSVTTPVRIPTLTEAVDVPEGGVVGIVRSLQSTLTRRMAEIADRTVGRVDVTVTGSRIERTGRTS